jgi:hyperosmotically inducible protein
MIKYILAIAVLTTGIAFAQNDPAAARINPAAARINPAAARINPAAARINKEVRHELVMLPYLDVFDNLSYGVDGTCVTLAGQVTRPILKTNAEKAVKAIDGVETVDNQIEVLPLSGHDDRLRVSLYRAIYGYTPLNRYALPVLKPIRIVVKTGHVTLEGVVDNQADKNTVNIRANGVHGVFSVTNNLRVVE